MSARFTGTQRLSRTTGAPGLSMSFACWVKGGTITTSACEIASITTAGVGNSQFEVYRHDPFGATVGTLYYFSQSQTDVAIGGTDTEWAFVFVTQSPAGGVAYVWDRPFAASANFTRTTLAGTSTLGVEM